MSEPSHSLITPTPWDELRRFTDARIALGRAGVSQPTAAHLAFQLAHAQARDAVHLPLDSLGVAASLQGLGFDTLLLHSQATDRATYLQRPDLGRRLDAASLESLVQWSSPASAEAGPRPSQSTSTRPASFDLALVVVDGLSALAIHQNAAPLLAALQQRLQADSTHAWSIAPVAVVEQGRVAIGDEVGAWLNASLVVVLIGERPGLSSPDSLGLYITWAPAVGKTDAQRNCISNVRAAGLSVDAASQTLHRLLNQARQKQLTGVGLKDHDERRLPMANPEDGGQVAI
ncbi:ethanolamine ammonia-lyase subunit EutC [Rhodoferax sp. 4810]|nr:ethanolamine ammonia-lyase subunit EutC [Rhodoferax jenense]